MSADFGTHEAIEGRTPDQPVRVEERIGSLDFTRGIAILGILLANIVAFGQPMTAYMYPDAFLVPPNDDGGWMWLTQFVLVDGKFRGLFTLLFGAGMVLFMERTWARGGTRWVQARRLFWLALFGAAHLFLVWRGDILFSYAICGFVALLCMRWEAKTQLTLGLLGFVAGSILYALSMGPLPFVADTPMGEQAAFAEMRANLEQSERDDLADGNLEAALIQSGDYAGFASHNIARHASDVPFFLFLWLGETLPLMLVGMGLYRMGFFSGGMSQRKLLRWGALGIVVGGALTLLIGLWTKGNGLTYYGTLAAFVGFSPLPRLPMILGYAAMLVLIAPAANGWLGQRISAAGRTAFTNYLGTSIAMMLVFHGWAGGLFGRLDRPELYVVVAIAWAAMLLWPLPWLARYRFGPLEWLWRCLTYGKVFPLRR